MIFIIIIFFKSSSEYLKKVSTITPHNLNSRQKIKKNQGMSASSNVYIFGIFDKGLVYSFNPVQLEIKSLEMPNHAKVQ